MAESVQTYLAGLPAFEAPHLIERGAALTVEIEFDGGLHELHGVAAEDIPQGFLYVIRDGAAFRMDESAAPFHIFRDGVPFRVLAPGD
jgi:hypothetical protein